jgi:hypothetical protein
MASAHRSSNAGWDNNSDLTSRDNGDIARCGSVEHDDYFQKSATDMGKSDGFETPPEDILLKIEARSSQRLRISLCSSGMCPSRKCTTTKSTEDFTTPRLWRRTVQIVHLQVLTSK